MYDTDQPFDRMIDLVLQSTGGSGLNGAAIKEPDEAMDLLIKTITQLDEVLVSESWSDETISKVEKWINVICILLRRHPSMPLAVSDDDAISDVEIYYALTTRMIPLFAIKDNYLAPQVSKVLRITFTILCSQFRGDLERPILFFSFVLSHVNSFLQHISIDNSSTYPRLLPEKVTNAKKSYLYRSSYNVVIVSMSCLNSLCGLLKISERLTCVLSRSLHQSIIQNMTEIWEYIRLKSRGFLDYQTIHKIFLETCSKGLLYHNINKHAWAEISSRWVGQFYRHLYQVSDDSKISVTVSKFILDLAYFLYRSQIFSSPFLKTARDLVLSDRDTHYLTKDISLSLVYLKKAFNSDEITIDFKEPFLNPKLETRRLNQYPTYCKKPESSQGTDIQQIVRTLFLHIAPTSGTIRELTGHFVMDFHKDTIGTKLKLVRNVGLLACYVSGNLTVGGPVLKCTTCDKMIPEIIEDRPSFGDEDFETIFTTIIQSDAFSSHQPTRLETFKAFKRVLTSFQPTVKFDDTTAIGRWIIQSLKSKSKVIRLAAGQLLPCLIKSKDGIENTENIFQFLSDVNFSDEPHLIETTITAWGQVARVCEGERLNVVLMKLIRILGWKNSFYCSLAFHSLQNLAKVKETTTWRLFAPFWPTVSLEIVKQLDTNKLLLKNFCDLLQTPPNEFLMRTMQFTIPYLITARRYSIVEQISALCSVSLSKIFFDNQSVILAVLLVKIQEVVTGDMELGDIIQLVQHRLQESGLVQENATFSVVAAPNVVKSSFEILKLYTPDSNRTTHITRALTCLGSVKFNSSNDANVLNQLFSPNNVLQIVTLCSNTVRNVLGRMSYTTKLQCLYGLSMLIQSAPETFKSAVPQICAFLQSALETDLLQNAALEAWKVMIEHLDGRNLCRVIDLTFSVIMQKWKSLTSPAQETGKVIVRKIVFEKLDIQENAELYRTFPALTSREEFGSDIVEASKKIYHQPDLSPFLQINTFITRCHSENIYVVRQCLQELKRFLKDEQKLVAEGWNAARHMDKVARLMYTLLNVPSRFHNSDHDISVLSVECIGLIGALDPHRTDSKCEDDQRLVLVHNFEQAQESKDFVFVLLERFLVKAFISSTDPDSQMYMAYGIQEFLKFCGLTPSNTGDMWKKFSLDTRFTIQPLLSSKYTVRDSTPFGCSYPIFTPNEKLNYNEWLVTFTLDLLSRAKGSNAEKIFGISLATLRNQDSQYLSVFNFLLPFAALNVIVTEGYSKKPSKLHSRIIGHDILLEIFAILNTPLGHDERLPAFHQTIFALIDYLTKWMRERSKLLYSRENRRDSKKKVQTDSSVIIVETFLSQISSDILAMRSFECNSYPRAIMYWENYFNSKNSPGESSNEEIYSKFQLMYVSIDDTDSLDGISTLFPKFDINQQILHYESTGRWDYALECYEATLDNLGSWDLSCQTKVLRCLKKAGRYEDLLGRLNRVVDTTDEEEIPEEWKQLGIEASWLAGNWIGLESWVRSTSTDSFEVYIGNALLALNNDDKSRLYHSLLRARENISGDISSSSVSSLTQNNNYLIKLHALADIEAISDLAFNGMKLYRDNTRLNENLESRLSLVGSDFGSRKYLLALRKSAMSISKLPKSNEAISTALVAMAQDARKLGQLESALRASLDASELGSSMGKVENAQILYEQGEQRKAAGLLEEVLGADFIQNLELGGKANNINGDSIIIKQEKDEISSISREQAEIGLLYTEWLDSSGEDGSETILKRYRTLTEMHPVWEKVHYRLAKYYNKLYDSQYSVESSFQSEDFLSGEYVKLMVFSYLRSLQCGVQYIYETLPKLITVWLDFSAHLEKGKSKYMSRRKAHLSTINKRVEKYGARIPSYVFYLVLPQLISRICHENEEVYKVIESLICNVVQDYPSRGLWPILGASNSKQEGRKKRGLSILTALSSRNGPKLRTLLKTGPALVKALSDLAYKPVQNKVPTMSLKSLDFDMASTPNDLAVPVQQMMNATLPSQPEAIKHHSPFPSGEVTIYKLDSTVKILSSMQQPKQIRIYGSNGEMYKILCKPNDDLRKDARLMEFTSSVDKLLKQDDAAAKRRLRIATYHVTPLNENFGLIEWVDGAIPIREVLLRLMNARGILIDWAEAKELLNKNRSNEARYDGLTKLVDKYPSVLHDWFLEMFPEPGSWLESRTRFVRTTAVMSMVGYILGLGDRHYENLLLLEKSGELMHVDFDCLFNKGIELETPERVPFRLTRNVTKAMGLSGYEGLFRRTCEVTLRLLRTNEDMLATILETFLHDPFVEWTQKKRRSRKTVDGIVSDRTAEEALTTIKNKLRGIKRQDSLALSVSGQVEYVVQQATNPHNLSKMYVGWMPFL